jgi:16S rRNA (adenine1518-N6/adenine1519-N6)-dimethyltransferase
MVARPTTDSGHPPGKRPVTARKRFGQHFLEPVWAARVVEAIAPGRDEVFIEIGPGRGALTRPLADRVSKLLAYEIDRDLAAEIGGHGVPNLTVKNADFLRVSSDTLRHDLSAIGSGTMPVRVAGNLPYNVASPILFRLAALFAEGIAIADATVMLQREVADRLTARPGTGDYGVLGILIGHTAEAVRLLALPPGAFRPAPKVHSAVIRLRFHAPRPPVQRPDVFAGMVQAIFTRRRKTLLNALAAFHLSDRISPRQLVAVADLDGGRRPETLSLHELARLADAFAGAVL